MGEHSVASVLNARRYRWSLTLTGRWNTLGNSRFSFANIPHLVVLQSQQRSIRKCDLRWPRPSTILVLHFINCCHAQSGGAVFQQGFLCHYSQVWGSGQCSQVWGERLRWLLASVEGRMALWSSSLRRVRSYCSNKYSTAALVRTRCLTTTDPKLRSSLIACDVVNVRSLNSGATCGWSRWVVMIVAFGRGFCHFSESWSLTIRLFILQYIFSVELLSTRIFSILRLRECI